MTVRHKETHEEFELIDKYSREWAVYDAHGERRLFKPNYLEAVEPVPAPTTWVDVTAECEFIASGPLGYIGFRHNGFTVSEDTGYRLRKSQVAPLERASPPSASNWVFLVEQGVL